MIPTLFEIGPIKIHSFGFMMAVSFLVTTILAGREFRRRGLNPELANEAALGTMIGGVAGAKIYYLLDHVSDLIRDPWHMIFSGSGLTWYGGLVGGMLGAFLVARWRRIPLLALCDIAAPLLGLGYAIGRVGCLLNGDDYGKPSNLPWAMTFPKGTPPTTEAVHPAQLYEVIGGLIIFFVLSGLKTRWSRPGALFGLYLLLAGVERFLVEFIRTNEPLLGGMTVAQIMSALLAAGGVAFLARKPSASGLPMNSSAAGDLGGPKSLA